MWLDGRYGIISEAPTGTPYIIWKPIRYSIGGIILCGMTPNRTGSMATNLSIRKKWILIPAGINPVLSTASFASFLVTWSICFFFPTIYQASLFKWLPTVFLGPLTKVDRPFTSGTVVSYSENLHPFQLKNHENLPLTASPGKPLTFQFSDQLTAR